MSVLKPKSVIRDINGMQCRLKAVTLKLSVTYFWPKKNNMFSFPVTLSIPMVIQSVVGGDSQAKKWQ